jgi:tRNA-specific 2-thiouridylase
MAADLGLRTASKPDSQDVCFITKTTGRGSFLDHRIPLTPGRVVDGEGRELGSVAAVELVTLGQRKGLGLAGGGAPRYAVDVDVETATITVGSTSDLLVDEQPVAGLCWSTGPVDGPVLVQTSAHGTPAPARIRRVGDGKAVIVWEEPHRRVAPGQSLVAYEADEVVGGAIAS